jgi:FtsP/CotA-like multicopper oxidase with cupredoxin domain
MTTGRLIIVDHGVALLSVAAWFAAAAGAAARRTRLTRGLAGVAVLVTLLRVATVAVLAGRGWWFVQEKVLLGLPLVVACALIAGLRPVRSAGTPASSVVALFTAGYAALAGLAVTLVAGYPLTWSTALFAVTFVGAGALLTARVVAVPPGPAPTRATGFSRRGFLGLAGGAVVAGTVAATGRNRPVPHSHAPAVSVADLRGATTPAPGGTKRQYVLTAQTATIRLPSGRDFAAWTFNGQAPGPPITATAGDLIEVTLRNTDIGEGVTLHWHGYDVPCGEDGAPGVTQQVVAPGGEFVYRFRADQVGTYWYHTHQASHLGVRRGLFGTLVVSQGSSGALDLTVPMHTFDGTLVLGDQDRRTVPPGTEVRLRLINTDSDPHRCTVAGTPLRVVAVDGRDLHGPGEVGRVALRLPAGGRYDLAFVMPDAPVALVVDDHAASLRLSPNDQADTAVANGSDRPDLDLLRYGTPAAVPFDAGSRADRHFTLVLDRGIAMVDGRPAYAQTVNGLGHPKIPDQLVSHGELVRFTVVNRGLDTHPWHLHGHPVLILARNGEPATGSPLWMDTFDVRPGEVWQVAFRATNPGIWMNHCHNLPHAHQGMMLRLRYDGVTTPFHSH